MYFIIFFIIDRTAYHLNRRYRIIKAKEKGEKKQETER
jgi:hypothetical protein